VSIIVFKPDELLHFDYINMAGDAKRRRCKFIGIDFGTNDQFQEPQFFLRCHDLDINAPRSFAINRIDAGSLLFWRD